MGDTEDTSEGLQTAFDLFLLKFAVSGREDMFRIGRGRRLISFLPVCQARAF